ncbi:hypothetical protein HYH08_18510 [Bradyrhizobium sp. BR 10289]|nr:hypothetical protein [Bradyrhizobium sp. BR 10289]
MTGLIVTAISSTPLQAREHRTGERHAERSMRSSIPRIAGERWFAAPVASAPEAAPADQPGGVCDHGDDPMIC